MPAKSHFRDMKFATLPQFQRRRLQTSTSQSAKSLRLPRETHRFRPSSNPPRLPTFSRPSRTPPLPRILQRVEIPAPATRNTLSTSKNVPSTWCFNDFDFQIALARRRGANFAKLNFKKRSEPTVFSRFWLPNRSRAQAWCKFCRDQLPKVLRHRQFLTILTSKSLSRAGVVQILSTSWPPDPPHHLAFRSYLCEPSKPRNYGKTQHFAQFLPAKTSLLWKHRCCKSYRQLSV